MVGVVDVWWVMVGVCDGGVVDVWWVMVGVCDGGVGDDRCC